MEEVKRKVKMKIYNEVQQEIAEKISPETKLKDWRNWKWQIKNSIKDLDSFEKLLDIKFDQKDRATYEKTLERFPLSITPYYLSLIDRENLLNDPVFKQSFADSRELNIHSYEMDDPLSEDKDSPVEGITHRYPDRVLFHVSNVCSMYCRHCTRKRKVGDQDFIPSRAQLKEGIEYIKRIRAE